MDRCLCFDFLFVPGNCIGWNDRVVFDVHGADITQEGPELNGHV